MPLEMGKRQACRVRLGRTVATGCMWRSRDPCERVRAAGRKYECQGWVAPLSRLQGPVDLVGRQARSLASVSSLPAAGGRQDARHALARTQQMASTRAVSRSLLAHGPGGSPSDRRLRSAVTPSLFCAPTWEVGTSRSLWRCAVSSTSEMSAWRQRKRAAARRRVAALSPRRARQVSLSVAKREGSGR